MHARALAPSPLARLLLELADRHADGSIDIGGRRIVLLRGAVADISALADDHDVSQFLVRAGEIDAVTALDVESKASTTGTTISHLLVEDRHVRLERLLEIERAIFVDRFLLSIGEEEEDSREPPPFVAGKLVDEAHHTYPLVPLMLDAYARHAVHFEAQYVSERVEQRVEMLETPFRRMALDWFGTPIGDGGALVSTLLSLEAAAAPRVASLLRTGLARMVAATSEAPPPPPRPNTLAPVPMEPREVTRSYPPSSIAPLRVSSVPPPRPAQVVLAPGGTTTSLASAEFTTALRAYAGSEGTLEDPLDRVEASIRKLEQAGAQGALRAAEWKEAARLWQTRYLSIEEASRAMREAAAADPGDQTALEQSAMLCAMLGDTRLACAYARAAASAAAGGPKREASLSQLAFYSRLAGDTQAAISALRSAAGAEDASARVFEELADLLVAQGENEEASEYIRSAAACVAEHEPSRARCLYTYANTLSPATPSHVRAMVALFEQSEMHEAAISYMAHVARTTSNPDEARGLRLDGAGRAESLGRPDIASELLLEAFDQEPHLEIVYEPLVADLEAAGAHEDLVAVIEDIAAASEDGREAWLARAEQSGRVSTTIGPYEAAAQKLRRSQRARDPVLARDAYALRAELGRSTHDKARALVGLARTLSLLGDLANAAARADQALQIDPHNADAARVLLQTFRALPRETAFAALDRARTALGESRDLFRFLIETAQADNDDGATLATVDAWCLVEPTFPEPARLRLSLCINGNDAAAIVAAATALLAPRAIQAHTPNAIVDAMARLHRLSASSEAIHLGLHAIDRLGADKKTLLDETLALCAETHDRHVTISALERALGPAAANARVPWLARIAQLHREQSDLAAEARTHLRILTTSLYDQVALHRLAEIYAGCAQGEKLLAVLGLTLESTEDPEARKQSLLDLAAAANAVVHDGARAEQFLASLFQESHDDALWSLRAAGALVAIGRPVQAVERLTQLAETASREDAPRLLDRAISIAELAAKDLPLALRTAARAVALAPWHAPLLLIFERLALATNEIALAEGVYRALVLGAYGPQTRRALHYRAARFFEKGGDAQRALRAYLEAFEHAPSAGVVFSAIERLAHVTERFEPLAKAFMTLADLSQHVDTRVRNLKRAAEVLNELCRDPARAFDVMLAAWETSTNKEREEEARQALATLLRVDPQGGESARKKFIGSIEKRCENAWDGEERGQWLVRAARVNAVEQTSQESTIAILEHAKKAYAEAQPEPESRVAFICDIAEILAAWPAERNQARDLVSDALRILPDDARVRTLAEDLVVPLPSHSMAPVPSQEATPRAALEPARDVAEGIESAFALMTQESVAPPDEATAPVATLHLAISNSHVRDVMASGDNEAATRLAEELSTDPTRVHEASQLLRAVVMRDPSRTTALRALYHLARGRGARGEADMLAGFVSLFDPHVPVPQASRVLDVDAELHAAMHADPHSTIYAKVFGTIWETAAHLYKKPLQAFHVFGTDRITPLVQSPVAQSFFAAAGLLDAVDVPLFGRRMGGNDLFVARTVPPCVIIGPTLDGSESDLRFRFARSLVLARSTNILVATLDEHEGRTLAVATVTAFGPTESSSAVDKSAASLAAELWRIIPPRAQREIRDLLNSLVQPLQYDAVRNSTFSQAARAGLVCAGDTRAATLALRGMEPALASADFSTEEGWQSACRTSHVMRELVRFALSSTWLAAITHK
jgi:hypothetical protein